MSPLRAQRQRRHGETRGGRVPQKMEFWGDVFYGWSLRQASTILEKVQKGRCPDPEKVVFKAVTEIMAVTLEATFVFKSNYVLSFIVFIV